MLKSRNHNISCYYLQLSLVETYLLLNTQFKNADNYIYLKTALIEN